MSNAMSIGPAIMINRLVDHSGTPPGAELAKIAQLRLALQQAVEQDRQKTANLGPVENVEPLVVNTGAVVDRLI